MNPITNQFMLVYQTNYLNSTSNVVLNMPIAVMTYFSQNSGAAISNQNILTSGAEIISYGVGSGRILPTGTISVLKCPVANTELVFMVITPILAINNQYVLNKIILKNLSILSSTATAGQSITINIYSFQWLTGSTYLGSGIVTNFPNWTAYSSTSIVLYDTFASSFTGTSTLNKILSLRLIRVWLIHQSI